MKLFRREFLAGAASLALYGLALAPAYAQVNSMAPAAGAPRRVVIVVAEGLSQPLIDFATPYARTTQDAEDATIAFDTLKTTAQSRLAPANALAAMRGLLKTAAQHGYKTGLVTTGDAAQTAGLFYDLPRGTEAEALAGGTVPFDVLGGGGRADFNAAQRAGLKAAGITALLDSDAFENTDQEIKGRVLALQADASLAFEVDRDAASEAGLSDLASYAMERLDADNAPYLLVIHDTLLARAIEAKDTVALLNQFRALNAIAGNVLSARTDDPALGMVMLATGSPTLPRKTTWATPRFATVQACIRCPVSRACRPQRWPEPRRCSATCVRPS